ncbi:DNA-binding protein [Burkholderia sp. Ac-20379]|uniref:DNA-binding protein n=1 Tax=Burkholderia sp. Ac-20379 TaxID=2703900 RepID=UPI001980A2D5|nr:DNA-binding protein [Burkholderia sp. Ac-20379]MBN3723618.1 DNA-binding protein [Burkholderia sp. Ac-20379]
MTLDDIRQSIRDELDTMRTGGARRQDLSLHACKRLFFDLGIRPSAANVRDLTQTGSASDIPKDIDFFWERIRSASKVRLEGSALPKSLEGKAGELLGALYEAALSEARTALDEERLAANNEIAAAAQQVRDAQIRHETLEAALARSENRAEQLQMKLTEAEIDRATASTHGAAHQDSLQALTQRLESENELLNRRFEAEQQHNASLRERIDALHVESRQSTEHYAQQIKDAVAEAERRVKPMLVELDSLRSMAGTYQAGLRDVNRKEFEFLQQLSAAKARADRLDEQLRSQGDELSAATREIETLRAAQGVPSEIAVLLQRLADAGQLDTTAYAAIGASLDAHVRVPGHCPKCEEGEPELSSTSDGFELLCPECDHTSGDCASRFEAVAQFKRRAGRDAP